MHTELIYYKARGYSTLGFMYELGRGVVKSKARALAHYYVAKALDPDLPDEEIADLEKSCTPSQLEKAENLGEEIMEEFEVNN